MISTRHRRSIRLLFLIFASMLTPLSAVAQPTLFVNRTTVNVQAGAGTNAASETVQISNSGNKALRWSVQESSTWLSVSPLSGTNTGTITLTFQTASLAQDTHNAVIDVQSNGGSAQINVTVTIQAGQPPPPPGVDISVSPTTPAPGSSVTVSFSGIPNPSSTDWISLAPAGSSLNTYSDWKYASSCTRTPGTARASGSCPFTVPSTAGNYEFRLFANDVFTLLDSVSFTITTSPPPPATLTVTCPANISVASPNGSAVVVNYAVTTSGGVAPITVTGTPASGSSFPVGTTPVQVNAKSTDGQTASCGFSVTVTFTPPPPGVDISVSSTTPAPGSSVTVSFSGIANPTSTDWISLAPAGSSLNTYSDWKYASSCTRTPGTARASGNCPFTVPSTAGNYEFRLFANDVFTLLDTVSFTITTSPPPPATLTVTCPANITTISPNGSAVTVNYSATTSGGVAPITVTGTPPSGSNFAVGTTNVQVNAKSTDGQTASCAFSVTVTFTPPAATGVGPQSTITCPAGAVNIFPGTFINAVVDSFPGATTFCLKTGVHNLDRSIIPKTGNTFVGEYGAILNGTWTTTDDTEAAFRAQNQDIDNVTIRNLVIRNLRRGIHGFGPNLASHWIIEFNEVGPNYTGVVFPSDSLVRNNYIHNNFNGGYFGGYAHNSLIENNEISYNGWEQKVTESSNVTFRNNYLHHNEGPGIWYDANNTNNLVEGNRLEDNGWIGIFYEISSDVIIRNNTILRSADTAIFISTSKNVQVYNNTLDGNFRGITYFLNCPAIGGGVIGFDLANNTVHDNTIKVGTQSGAIASAFAWTGSCTTQQMTPYVNGSKNLAFTHNAYDVPSPTTVAYWLWWTGFKFFNEWQGLGMDTTGSVQ